MGLGNYLEGGVEQVFGSAIREGGKIQGHVDNALNNIEGHWDQGICQEEHEHGSSCCPPCQHDQFDESCETCVEFQQSWSAGGSGGGAPACGHSQYDESCQSCSEHWEVNPPPCGHIQAEEGCENCEEHRSSAWSASAGGVGGPQCGHQSCEQGCESCEEHWNSGNTSGAPPVCGHQSCEQWCESCEEHESIHFAQQGQQQQQQQKGNYEQESRYEQPTEYQQESSYEQQGQY